jgi:predicted RNA-binding protein with PUA-like domain
VRYWLIKSEPDAYSIDDLERDGTEHWDGVRNYQARNLLRDEIKKRDGVLFHHSSTKPSGIVGIAQVVREGYPDPTAFDSKEKYFDPKSDPDSPTWYAVDVQFEREFGGTLTLPMLRDVAALEDMVLLKKGMRLSIQPVTKLEWDTILKLAKKLS